MKVKLQHWRAFPGENVSKTSPMLEFRVGVLLFTVFFVSPDLFRGCGGEFGSRAMRPLNAKPMQWLGPIFIVSQEIAKIGYRHSPVRQGFLELRVEMQAMMPLSKITARTAEAH